MKFIRVFLFLFLATALVQCASDTNKKGAAKAKAQKTAKAKKPGKAKGTKAKGVAAKTAKKGSGVVNTLGLTADQKKKFAEINQKYFKKGAEFRKANEGKKDAIKKNAQTLNAAKDKEMKALLKPDQYTKYKQATQRKKPAKK